MNVEIIAFFTYVLNRVLDNFIGRAAHIQFLENESLMKMLLSDFRSIFIWAVLFFVRVFLL